MRAPALLIFLLPALIGQAPAVDPGGPAARDLRERLREIYLAEASGYTIYLVPTGAIVFGIKRLASSFA